MNSGALAAIISGVLVSILFWLAERKAKKMEAEMDAGDFIVRQPKFALGLYIFLSIPLLIVIAIVDFKNPNNYEALLVGSPFLLLGPFLIILWFRYKIVVKGNQITSTTYFGKKKTYTFDYITLVKRGIVTHAKGGSIDTIIAYHDKKKLFRVTAICPGFNVLGARLMSENVFHIGL
jgi:hypothetical protein